MKTPPGKNRQRLIFLLILFTTSAGFFIPVPNQGWVGFSFKGILFLIDLFLIAMVWLSPLAQKVSTREEERGNVSTSDGIPEGQTFKENRWEGYGKAFRGLSNEYVSVIRRTFSASCAAFYLKNDQGALRIHAADGADVETQEFQETENNLVGRVFLQKTPYLNGALPTGFILPGMTGKEIRSFLGAPLQWDNKTVGVLALGSDVENDFSEEDRGILVRYGDLLIRIMAAYHRGQILETDYEVVKTQVDLETALKSAEDEDAVIRSYVEQMEKLFPFDRFAVCFADGKEGLIRYVYGQMDQQKPGMRFPLDDGLIGWVLKRKVPLLIPDIQKGDYFRPRYLRHEAPNHGLHSFLCVPLGKDDRFKGCLSMESRNSNQYNDKIKDVFCRLTEQLDYALERIAWMRPQRTHPPRGADPVSSQFELE